MSELNGLAAQQPDNKLRDGFSTASASMAAPSNARTITMSAGLKTLTPRQKKVFSLLSFGFSNKEIAAMLAVAESTIKAHVCAIFHAFGCTNRVQAALIGYSMRLHSPPTESIPSARFASKDDIERLSSFFD